MGRLEQNQRKQVFFWLAVLIIVIILIATVGLRVVLNASSFIAQVSEDSSSTQLKRNQSLIEDIDIDNIPIATNSPKIFVGGSVVNFNIVEFYLNGDLVKETSLISKDNFNEEIGDLNKGANEIYVIGKLKNSDEEKKSQEFTVIYKDEKPKLEIREPQEGAKTNNSEVSVVGTTDKETYIRVNDLPVVVDTQGGFQTSVRLKEGENKIKITAQDIAENIEEKTLTIIYERD